MRPGDRIGRYTVVRELGRGGMGAVVVAHDPALGREVAIKLMLATTRDDPTLAERFRREAETAARVRHPHIVAVHEAGLDQAGRPFIAQELVDGPSLQDRLDREGPLAPLEAAALVRDLTRAVAHAHALGVLHRDIKPANVLLAPDGRALITDFGLAKDALAARDLTRTGELLGTASYMAPEQAGEGAKHVDARADIYALGGVLYALLTGRPPFVGASLMNVLAQLMEERPAPPSRLRPGVPPALDALCLRCLEKRPTDRPPTAEALADALDAILAGERIHLPPGRPRPGRLALVAVVLTTLLAGVAGLAFVALPDAAGPAAAVPPPADDPLVRARPLAQARPAPSDLPAPAERPWRWERATLTPIQPPPLVDAAAAFDASRRAVVFYGGWDGSSAHSTLWSWDGREVRIHPPLDPPRSGAALVALEGHLLVVQGARPGVIALDDARALEPGGNWRDLRPPRALTPRSRAAFVAVPDRGLALLVGGRADKKRRLHLADLWSVTPQGDWTDLTVPGPQPAARHSAAIAYDRARRRVVLFGGETVDGYLDDLWEWTPAAGWVERVERGPPARAEGRMVFDGARCLLLGGVTGTLAARTTLDDLWAWDGQRWTAVPIAGPRPAPHHLPAFAWDDDRGVGVLYGGGSLTEPSARFDDLWELHPPG